MCACGSVHDTGWCMFAVVSQQLRHPGVLPGGGGQVTLHFSAALTGPAPSAHSSLSPVFPGPLGSGFLLLPFPDPISLAARNPRLLLLGGCCIIGPNPLTLEVRKLSPKEGQGLVPIAQRLHAKASTRIQAPGSFPLDPYCLFLCERSNPRLPHWIEPHSVGLPPSALLLETWVEVLPCHSIHWPALLLAVYCWAPDGDTEESALAPALGSC